MTYEEFLTTKKAVSLSCGFEKPKREMNPGLFEWQADIIHWALKKGRSAIFADCGLGKTVMQLQWAQSVSEYTGKPVLIVCPLAVAEQTKREADKFRFQNVSVVREREQVRPGTNITNYEILNHFDAETFGGVVLDESSILKNYSGKTRTEIIGMFGRTPYKLSCTATPAPNDYMELGNQAEFCGVMSRSEMLATYFIHDGGETSKWRLKGHAHEKFWEWLASWAVVMTNPRDLGYDGTGFDLPEKRNVEHVVKQDTNIIDDNYSLFAGVAQTLNDRRGARRDSLKERCKLAADLVAAKPEEQWLVWCDLNAEADELKRNISWASEVRGTDDPVYKVETLNRFSTGDVRCLITKSRVAGLGMNWQRCHNMIFVGLSDSFEAMYQSIRRCWRFGQEHTVDVHIITSEAEGAVKDNIERKEKQAEKMVAEMVKHTRDILERDIRGTVKISVPYNPQVEMTIPEWLTEEVA